MEIAEWQNLAVLAVHLPHHREENPELSSVGSTLSESLIFQRILTNFVLRTDFVQSSFIEPRLLLIHQALPMTPAQKAMSRNKIISKLQTITYLSYGDGGYEEDGSTTRRREDINKIIDTLRIKKEDISYIFQPDGVLPKTPIALMDQWGCNKK